EEQQRQLNVESEDVEQQRAEAGRVAQRRGPPPADGCLPGRQPEDPEDAEVDNSSDVMPRAPRDSQPFTDKDGTEQRDCTSAVLPAHRSGPREQRVSAVEYAANRPRVPASVILLL